MPIAQSSHLQSYDYDPESRTLLITFVTGAIYRYYDVPQTEYWNLVQSGGAGSYFHAKIRNNYSFTKIFDPRAA